MLTLVLLVAALAAIDQAIHRRVERRVAAGASIVALGLICAAYWSLPGGGMVGKVIGHLAMPAGLVWLAGAGAALGLAHGRRWRGAALATALWTAYTIAGNGFLGAALLASIEADYAQTDPMDQGPFDAVFVLGGGTREGPGGRPQVTRSGDRVVLAARMFHARRTPFLVASGSSPPGASRQEDGAAATALIWQQLGVPSDAIYTLAEPYNTRTEIAAYEVLAAENGWQNVGLISSAWHLRRATALAENASFVSVVPLPADFRGVVFWDGFDSLIPHGSGFLMMHRACWELLGRAVGR